MVPAALLALPPFIDGGPIEAAGAKIRMSHRTEPFRRSSTAAPLKLRLRMSALARTWILPPFIDGGPIEAWRSRRTPPA